MQRRAGVALGVLAIGLAVPSLLGTSTPVVAPAAAATVTTPALPTSAVVPAEARTGPGSTTRPIVVRPARRPVHRITTSRSNVFVSGPTGWSDLNAAIARIPTYRSGVARWVVGGTGGSWWGTADWYDGVIYINPSTPTVRLYDVAVHEWSHLLSVRDYGGNVDLTVTALSHAFDASGVLGAERAADCMALLQGARWVHYTWCRVPAWRAMARRLLRGDRV